MKINVEKLISGKIGTSSTHKIDEELEIREKLLVPVQGKVELTRNEKTITAHFDITANINVNWDDDITEATRQQIPLNFKTEYDLAETDANEGQPAIDNKNKLDTTQALLPELKINLPIQTFYEDNED